MKSEMFFKVKAHTCVFLDFNLTGDTVAEAVGEPVRREFVEKSMVPDPVETLAISKLIARFLPCSSIASSHRCNIYARRPPVDRFGRKPYC